MLYDPSFKNFNIGDNLTFVGKNAKDSKDVNITLTINLKQIVGEYAYYELTEPEGRINFLWNTEISEKSIPQRWQSAKNPDSIIKQPYYRVLVKKCHSDIILTSVTKTNLAGGNYYKKYLKYKTKYLQLKKN
jgi:hypothetical protein